MRVPIAMAAIACLAVAGVSGCTHEETCGIADYGGGGTGGYQTARQALNSVLAQHNPGLSATGWVVKDKGAVGESFASGDDSVDVVKTSAGKWVVGGVTTCY
jgi:hypothetical protein